MRNWFTSDYHLGHANIIRYCKRPFKSLEEMNKVIIRNHNQRVKPGDTVFHIGDFCFRNSPGGKRGEGDILKSIDYEKQLNGKIIFIKGNHDKNNSTRTIIENIKIKYGGKEINLVHSPKHFDYRYGLNFVGHIHGNWKCKRVYYQKKCIDLINVGVDVWNFRPVSFEEIYSRYRGWLRSIKKGTKNDKLI